MNKLDFEEISKHINILNVVYHLSLEITATRGVEVKAICPFCGYNKNSKIATLSLNTSNNKYCCSRCGAGGFSIGLYAKLRNIDNKKAYRELLDKECFSMNKSNITISPINELADIETRDIVYREFLNMLSLNIKHENYLKKIGFLDSSIDNQMYRSAPRSYIKRKLIANSLKRKYNLCGIPGFYQDEDFVWSFSNVKGFFVPCFDDKNKIQGLSIHLDETYNGKTDMWFSSSKKINGTAAKNWISESNITTNTQTVILTDDLLLGNLIKYILNVAIISFLSISNSYQILKVLDNTNIKNIIFTIRSSDKNQHLDYIISKVFKDLVYLGYNLETKYVKDYKDILKDDFLTLYTLKKVS
jgi:DNA primase